MSRKHQLPSEGLDWTAGSYNPAELEEWKRKIYGTEYYDEETPSEAPIWNNNNSNHGSESSSSSNNNNNNKRRGNNSNNNSNNTTNLSDRYFDDNIAAVSSNWDREENCVSIFYQRPRAFLEKHFKNRKHMVLGMIGMFVMMVAMVAMSRSGGTETAIPAATNAFGTTENNEPELFDDKKPKLFETKTADLVLAEQPSF